MSIELTDPMEPTYRYPNCGLVKSIPAEVEIEEEMKMRSYLIGNIVEKI